MKFGMCTGSIDKTKLEYLKKIGYDYFETSFRKICFLGDDEFQNALSNVLSSGLPCLAANSMLPSSFKIADDGFDTASALVYIQKGLERVSLLGAKKVVFGSGGARSTPKGADKVKSYAKVVEFLKSAAHIAAGYDITIVIEPLSPFECNLINTIKQSAALALATGEPNIKAHADFFHMKHSGDSVSAVLAGKDMVAHSHISNPATRMFPTKKSAFYQAYIQALDAVNCESCSVEGWAIFFNSAAKKSIKLLKQIRR